MSDDDGYDPLAVKRVYDGMAGDYAVRFGSELADADPGDPDIGFLAAAADSFPDGHVVDLGCGPAQVSRFLIERGRSVVGIDFAIGMLTEAGRLVPGAAFVAADLLELPLRDGSCAAVIASYSLHHLPKERLPAALAGIHAALAPGGVIVVITHGGAGAVGSASSACLSTSSIARNSRSPCLLACLMAWIDAAAVSGWSVSTCAAAVA